MTQFQPPMGMSPGGMLKPHRGVLILVFGILGLVVCFIFGIVAFIMGGNDLREMDAGAMDPSGRGLTQAGRIIGIISSVLAVVGILIFVLLTVIGAGAAAAGAAAGGP